MSPVVDGSTDDDAVVHIEPHRGFTSFYADEHEGQVRRAYLMLGTTAAAHDVVADAFLAVFNRWSSIESPGPYLNRCVLNGCRDAAGSRVREDLAADVPERTADPEDEHLADVLMALPFRQRAAVVLRFYRGLSEAEIAEQLDCRPGTVGSLIHRGLAQLKRELTKGDDR